ncbi:isoprenoid synthase domain-containing protein [Amanita rubescens]|nr:isoprenoid synthase domain-containing protein [Amanita rubescens]
MTDAVSRTEISFFRRTNTQTKLFDFDKELFTASCEKIKQLGYPLDDPATMKAAEPYMKLGPMITVGLYPHVTDQATRVFISVYAGLTTLIDDAFADKPGPISEFNYRFVRGIPQEYPALETFARLLRLFREHWNPVMADMLLQSSMMFITSITLEHAVKDAELPTCRSSLELARSFRDMSGISTLYCLWMFSPDTPPEMFMAGLHPISRFINIANDVLSFYKEELASSYSSLWARTNNTSQLDAFKKMVNDAVDIYRDLEMLAEKYPCMHRPQIANLSGYFRYHLTLLGYRLIELLELDCEDIS